LNILTDSRLLSQKDLPQGHQVVGAQAAKGYVFVLRALRFLILRVKTWGWQA